MEGFSDAPELARKIAEAMESTPALKPLFMSISAYAVNLSVQNRTLRQELEEFRSTKPQPESKKRKLEDKPLPITVHTAWREGLSDPDYAIPDISFTGGPVRKKLRLEVCKGELKGIRGMDQANSSMVAAFGWDTIDQLLLLPVPEKSQPQWNFVLVPKTRHPSTGTAGELDSMILTVGQTALKAASVTIADGSHPDPETRLVDFIQKIFNAGLAPLGKSVTTPSPAEFTSALVQAHRKDEKAYHVKAFKGSKDGFLYFLSTGIIFGFRKPILYFPFGCINSISYSSILQRTFNLTITSTSIDTDEPETSNGAPESSRDYEFSMVDQADYQGIDDYVKRHGLNDASLAKSRRAQVYNVNKMKQEPGITSPNGQTQNEDMSELAKAEQALQDAEDEEEEDYDPGSEGESDGSGTDSEEDGEGGGDEGMTYDDEDGEEE